MLDYKIIQNAFTINKMYICIHLQLYIKKGKYLILSQTIIFRCWHINIIQSEPENNILQYISVYLMLLQLQSK